MKITQVSKDIAEDALTILEGLGLLATEYGFMDYLHGHYPESVNHKDQIFVVKFPAIEKIHTASDQNNESIEQNIAATSAASASASEGLGGYFVSVSTGGSSSFLLRTTSDVPNANSFDYHAKTALSGLNTEYEQQHELILLSILRAVDGLKGTQKERLRVVCLRVQCLLIISHSRLTHDLLHPYIKAGSTVLRDLISLSDISSEALSGLQLEYSSLSAVTLILNCILGVFEFNLRRRGPLLAGILLELGLTRTGECAVLCCAVLCCAVLCCAVLCCAVLCCTILCCAVLCCAVLCCAVLCCAVLCCTVLYCTMCCAVLFFAVLCCAVLCCAVLCCAVLYCTILYCTVLYCTVL